MITLFPVISPHRDWSMSSPRYLISDFGVIKGSPHLMISSECLESLRFVPKRIDSGLRDEGIIYYQSFIDSLKLHTEPLLYDVDITIRDHQS